MEKSFIEHIRVKASLAVLVIDDYTDKVIRDSSVQVFITGAKKPVRKSEGYYVFLNLSEKQVSLSVQCSCYAVTREIIDLTVINPLDPVVKIRLKPDRCYPLPKGTASLSGTARPDSEILVYCDQISRYYRLLYDYTRDAGSKNICIYNPEKTDLDGKILWIKAQDEQESFRILSTVDRDKDQYLMEGQLAHDYKKAGTKVFPVTAVTADSQGEYFLPLWNLNEEVTVVCEMRSEEIIRKNITIEPGKMNQLNLMQS